MSQSSPVKYIITTAWQLFEDEPERLTALIAELRQRTRNLNIAGMVSVPFDMWTTDALVVLLLDALRTPRGDEWQPIETAPKEISTVRVLLWAHGEIAVGYWDAYYAEGGRGYTGRSGFVDTESNEIDPTHWRPLPSPPGASHA